MTRRRPTTACLPIVMLGSLWLAAPARAVAQTAVPEVEPNDTPATATRVSGAAVLMGTLAGRDQDGFLWTVSDAGAQTRWTFDLEGIPGALTVLDVLRIEYAENGVDVTGRKKLITIGSRDGVKPAVLRDVLLEPGEYLLGVAFAGAGAPYRPPVAAARFDDTADAARPPEPRDPGGYRLTIREADRLRLDAGSKPNDSRESARALRPDTEYAAYTPAGTAWFTVALDAKQAAQHWEIAGQVPIGRAATALLRDAAGKELARTRTDAQGRFAFADLGLSAGSYHTEIQEGSGGLVLTMAVRSVGARVDGAEAEPNDTWTSANRVALATPLTGRFGRRDDTDHYAFSLDEEASDRLVTLALETAAKSPIELCLLDVSGTALQCRQRSGGVALADLMLAPGTYGLRVGRGAAGAAYSVTLTAGGIPAAGAGAEPNDTVARASTVPASNRISGTFDSADDVDVYRFVATGSPQLWRFQVNGDQIHEVAYHDGAGIQHQRVRAQKGRRRVRLDNVLLVPGEHHVSVSGRGAGVYTLLALPVGPPDPNGEQEPNDDPARTQRLAFGQTRTGLLSDPGDQDNYRFFLAGWDHIRLEVTPPADGALHAYLYWDTTPIRQTALAKAGQPLVLDGLFPPGDYRLALSPRTTSEAEYRLTLQRRPRFACPADCEPNDDPAFARPVPPTLVVEGRAGEWQDADWWALPVLERETELVIRSSERRELALVASLGYAARSIITWDQTVEAHRAVVPARTATFLQVKPAAAGHYRLELQFADGPKPAPVPAAPSVRVGIELEATRVAAYHPHGQLVGGRLTLAHLGGAPLEVALDSATSDTRFRVTFDRDRIALADGARETVAVSVHVPPDVSTAPVRISARATGPAGAHVEAHVELEPSAETAAVNPRRTWLLPESLRGGVNAARETLGGRLVLDAAATSPGTIPGIGDGFDLLFDGLAVRNAGLSLRGGHGGRPVVPVTVELAGTSPVDVAGFAFHAFSQHSARRYPKDVVLQLSTDGSSFETVATATLDPVPREQYVTLPGPRPARFARLLLDTNWEGKDDGILGLGEWKVIARPGTDISGGKGFNIAAPELGGHVVWARPGINVNWDDSVVTPPGDASRVRLAAGERLAWVIGFHHSRAARITRLEWADAAKSNPEKRLRVVDVSVSLDSPVGPWRSLGEWTLPAAGGAAEFRLAAPVWARYVRFSTPVVEARDFRETPDVIRIWERPSGPDYRSILTEWGYASQEAFYEASQDIGADTVVRPSGHQTRATAAPIAIRRPVSGQVALGRSENWYRLSVPAGQNSLAFTMSADPTVRTELHLETASGASIPLRRVRSETTPSAHVLEATVEPGATVFARVSEPPRNVVFAWDTSGSVGRYIPIVYNAMMAYSRDLVPGRDAVNLLPFGADAPLMREWYGEPHIVQTVLNEHDRPRASSEAEKTLYQASKALAGRAGTKAIVVITDAVTTRFEDVWSAFADVQPRVFALGVSVVDAAPQDRMQDWARVSGGHYTYLMNEGELEVAFERVSALLRQPAPYTLVVESRWREAPGPGRLTVVTGSARLGAAAGAAIELILDASGSMLQRIGGKRRIDIAREVLTGAIRDAIPHGTPVALRVFGHREAGSCRTDLEVPLAPLDPAAMARRIQAIGAMNLAKTPIANSLARVETDLRGAKGPKVVVLVTDGEETCGGDPEQVVRDLRDKGVDVTLNIVGFAIDDAGLESRFERWAELGGGRYLRARDQAALGAALTEALKTPFTVFDDGGEEIATGVVDGEPLTLPAGRYRVVVAGAPARTFDGVEVAGERAVRLEVARGR